MRPHVPDLSSLRARLTVAGALALTLAGVMAVWHATGLGPSLGDTDDAMRLVMVRELLGGRGWFDQQIHRLQPPVGVWMHWSRLIDGGLAALDLLFRPFVGPARAEAAMRTVWPLLWLFPASAAALSCASALAGPGERGATLRTPAVLAACGLILLGVGQLALQFHPGRIDHHDVQITLALAALAGAMSAGGSVRGAWLCGAATGLGLAIGLEALLFDAAIAGAMGLRFLADRLEARRVRAYGLALAACTALAFLAQTPPARWGVPACDALGSNLLAGAVVGGLLLALAARATSGRDWPWRLGALAAAGAVALAVYLALDPHCLRGPFADVDPRIRPFWLDHVNEVKSIGRLWKSDRADAVTVSAAAVMGLCAWAGLGLDPARRRDPAWWTLGLALALGVVAAATAVRMRSYLEWFAVPPLAVVAAQAAMRLPRLRALAALAMGALLTPVIAAGVVLVAMGASPVYVPPVLLQWMMGPIVLLGCAAAAVRARRLGWRGSAGFAAILVALTAGAGLLAFGGRLHAHAKPKRPDPPDTCFDARDYAPLARAPAGLVLSEVDLGPFVLAHTPSSAMSAPYHRMSWGLLKDRAVMVAPADGDAPDSAQAKARALGATYVLECSAHSGHADRDHLPKNSLQARLDDGDPPDWLDEITPDEADLEVYRIKPAAAPKPPSGPSR